MDLTFTFSVATAIIVLTYIFRRLTQKRGLPLPPGPFALPLLGHLPFIHPDLHRYFADLSRTYGPVMTIRLGLKLSVVLSSPSAVREALIDNGVTFANHDPPAVTLAVTGAKEDILWAPYGPIWRTLRKVSVLELLGPASVEAVRPQRRAEVRRMVAKVYASVGSPVEIRELTYLTALNFMARMMWGGSFDGEGELGREFKQVMDGVTELLTKPNISDFFPILAPLDIQGLGRRMVRMTDWYHRIFDAILDERRKKVANGENNNQKDFLQVMLELLDRKQDSREETLTILHVKGLFLVC